MTQKSEVPTQTFDLQSFWPADDRWSEQIAQFDWPSVGVLDFQNWDPALTSAVRLLSVASVPMSLMIGPRGLLVPNAGTAALFSEVANGPILGRAVGDVLTEASAFYAEVLALGFAGESSTFRDQPVRIMRRGLRETLWFNLHFVPVADAAGRVLAVLGIASEVTDYMRQTRHLRDSEQRLRLALESSGMVGVWDFDVKSNVSTSDANVARIYGLSASDCLRGVSDDLFLDAIHQDDRVRVVETLRRAVETGTPYLCQYRVPRNADTPRWVVTSAKPSYDDQGELVRMLGAVVDVTDQIETETALAESRFRFETLTEALPQIVWSSDADGRHDYFSPRWSEFTGIPLNEIGDGTWKQLIYPEHRKMVCNAWSEALRTGTPYDLDYRFRHHSGEFRWLRVMARPIRDEEGRVTRWFGTSTDVHESYRAAEERTRLAVELERLATEDPLTEVLTRRAFFDRASAAMAIASQTSSPISLLMMDIDHFKAINDTYGHPAGDSVLAVAARRIKAAIKPIDLVGRIGGEEFAVLLHDCAADQAKTIADRICRAFDSALFSIDSGSTLAVTVSVGATTRLASNDSLHTMLHVADRALYRAKAMGRNRSIFSGPGGSCEMT